ncbi:aspartyl protease [Microcystis aeruginosa BLCCF158]|uniref:Aspartyl protease n=1 Tax=Microcystis aeruginosa BLCC-F158 TaxID=2755316 RepID=A0A841UUL4_MICAE|nr:aspartyl protease [Microcystis aeruginosa]MBC1194763.1 aspartyl protease [Microcystis aeruginosa BLCC-F158]
MIVGRFGENGELLFEIDLIAANGEQFTIEVLLDTGFTTGWLAINSQDLEALQWTLIASQIEMQTARGKEFFDLYEGQVIIDGKEFIIPVHAGDEIPETLLGSQWLEIVELVVNKSKEILTIEIIEFDQ